MGTFYKLWEVSEGGPLRSVRAHRRVAIGSARGLGLLVEEGEVVKQVQVSPPLVSAHASEVYAFGGNGEVVKLNYSLDTIHVDGVVIALGNDRYGVVYKGGVSKIVDLYTNEVITRIKDVVRGLLVDKELMVAVGNEGTYLIEDQHIRDIINIEKGRGVAKCEDGVCILARDPYFIDVSHIYKIDVNDDPLLVNKVTISGLAYDIDSDEELVVVSTSYGVYLFNTNLEKIFGLDVPAYSATVHDELLCYSSKGLVTCGVVR